MKVTGRGSRSKSQILFFLTYLKIWIIPRFTLFTEWQKIRLLPRYDVAKLGTTRSFRGICMENYRKNGKKIDFFSSKKSNNFSPNYSFVAIFGQVIGKIETKNL